jgi:hypothetical protein
MNERTQCWETLLHSRTAIGSPISLTDTRAKRKNINYFNSGSNNKKETQSRFPASIQVLSLRRILTPLKVLKKISSAIAMCKYSLIFQRFKSNVDRATWMEAGDVCEWTEWSGA